MFVLPWFALLLSANLVAAQDRNDPAWLKQNAARLLYHVRVTGKLAPTNPEEAPMDDERHGKAFAVGQNLFITARHILGNDSDWKARTSISRTVHRAAHIPDRQIELFGAAVSSTTPAFAVHSEPSNANAAGIIVPTAILGDDEHLNLSICAINQERTHRALMSGSAHPADPSSLSTPVVVELEPLGYRPDVYGPLFIFEPTGALRFHAEPDGHEGSPIVNDENDVVGFVSAVVLDGTRPRVLATLIHPLFPGAIAFNSHAPVLGSGANRALRCSMGDVVKQLHDRIADHLVWTVHVEEYPQDKIATQTHRLQDDLTLSYERLSADNVIAIDIEYQFLGKESDRDQNLARLPHPAKKSLEINNIRPESDGYSFKTREIIRDGKNIYNSIEGNGGYIQSVVIKIFPILQGGRRPKDERGRDRQWVRVFSWR